MRSSDLRDLLLSVFVPLGVVFVTLSALTLTVAWCVWLWSAVLG